MDQFLDHKGRDRKTFFAGKLAVIGSNATTYKTSAGAPSERLFAPFSAPAPVLTCARASLTFQSCRRRDRPPNDCRRRPPCIDIVPHTTRPLTNGAAPGGGPEPPTAGCCCDRDAAGAPTTMESTACWLCRYCGDHSSRRKSVWLRANRGGLVLAIARPELLYPRDSCDASLTV